MKRVNPAAPLDLIETLRATAVKAGQAYTRQGQAFESERQAEERLLTAVLEMVRPGLESIVDPIGGTGLHGAKLGEGIWIYGDGRLGEVGGATGTAYLPRTPAEVLETHDLASILAPLAALFEKQIRGRGPSTIAAEHRAARLAALLRLLEE